MTTISYIELVNFQSHVKTRVDLADFTALVGQSSSGKTAIIRALLWLFYGEWDERFPYDPEQVTAVAVGLSSGARIVRMRRGDENKAIVTVPGNPEPYKYKDFGYQIPGVFDLVNFRPIVSGKNKVNLNFSTQDDPVFMVSDLYSKPAKAQWLGRLYGAHVVNNMLRLMAKDKKDAQAKVELEDTQLSAYQKQLREFDDLDAKEALLAEAEADMAKLRLIEAAKAGLERLQGALEQLSGRVWILKVDTAKIRAAVEKLGQLERYSENLGQIAETEALIVKKRALLQADLPALRQDIESLRRLSAASQAIAGAAEDERRVVSKRALLAADLPAIRKDIESLQRMLAASQALGAAAVGEAKISAKRPLLAFDAEAAKAELRHLQALSMLSSGLKAVVAEMSDAESRNQSATGRLERAKESVKSYMVRDGKCLICGGEPHVSADVVSHNLRTFIVR